METVALILAMETSDGNWRWELAMETIVVIMAMGTSNGNYRSDYGDDTYRIELGDGN